VEFGIILQGNAAVYGLKDREHFTKEAGNGEKFEKFKQHKRIIEELGFFSKWRNWNTQKQAKIQASLNIRGSPVKNTIATQQKDTYKEVVDEFNAKIEEIFSLFKSLYGTLDTKNGIKTEDLFLIMHHDNPGHEYFKDGVSLYHIIQELKDGDVMEELGLLTGVSVKNTIIAIEELHILTIAQGEFYSLFNTKVPNLVEKKEFILSVFPDLLSGLAVKMASIVEEKIYMSRESIYEQGEEPEAFYILKSGGIQVLSSRLFEN